MTVPGGIDHRREGGDQRLLGRLVVFVLWLIAVLLFGLVECSIFWLSAIDGSGCPSGGSLDIFGPTRTGGAASGGALLMAIVSGLSLWLAALYVPYRDVGHLLPFMTLEERWGGVGMIIKQG